VAADVVGIEGSILTREARGVSFCGKSGLGDRFLGRGKQFFLSFYLDLAGFFFFYSIGGSSLIGHVWVRKLKGASCEGE